MDRRDSRPRRQRSATCIERSALRRNATTLPTPTAPNYLTGVSSILCESDQQLNKTGTLMLASPEPANLAPQSVTVTMKGAGIEGLFLGVLL